MSSAGRSQRLDRPNAGTAQSAVQCGSLAIFTAIRRVSSRSSNTASLQLDRSSAPASKSTGREQNLPVIWKACGLDVSKIGSNVGSELRCLRLAGQARAFRVSQ
jgi:hypothetical protein